MAEYTLGQVIDKLGRNPNLKFEFIGDKDTVVERGTIIHLSEDGYILDRIGTSILSYFSLNSRFRLVNEPVDVMAAFKAFSRGKTVYCDYEGEKYYYTGYSAYGDKLIDNLGNSISVEEILHGKWFIEEGEK